MVPPASWTRASVLSRRFQKILMGVALAPIPVAVLVACSAGSGVAASELANAESGANTCQSLSIPDAGACESYLVTVTDACELDSGSFSLPSKTCEQLCGRAVVCGVYGIGKNQVNCGSPCPVDGRRYDLLDDRDAPVADSVGAYLARMAFFEAASVDAFDCLARDLSAHGAPSSLVRSCRRARNDEIRHARMARTIAERHGGIVGRMPPAPPSSEIRSLEEIAIENAVEGCVRETFGVVVGMWQAKHAPSPELRAYFAALTKDEVRHAALAGRIDAWLLSQLSAAAREHVEDARIAALAALSRSLRESEPLAGLGLPSRDEARALFEGWCDRSKAA